MRDIHDFWETWWLQQSVNDFWIFLLNVANKRIFEKEVELWLSTANQQLKG